MIAVIDYDAGNIKNVERAFRHVGADIVLTADEKVLDSADKIVFPGVGAFGLSMDSLNVKGIVPAIKRNIEKGKPFLGICLGMQMLFEASEESPEASGLSVLPGNCVKIVAPELKVPQIGWNSVKYLKDGCPIFKNIPDESYFYFVHSYHVKCTNPDDAAAVTTYGKDLQIAVWRDNVYGVQFHPEKSGDTGMVLLENFCGI